MTKNQFTFAAMLVIVGLAACATKPTHEEYTTFKVYVGASVLPLIELSNDSVVTVHIDRIPNFKSIQVMNGDEHVAVTHDHNCNWFLTGYAFNGATIRTPAVTGDSISVVGFDDPASIHDSAAKGSQPMHAIDSPCANVTGNGPVSINCGGKK
jgi:hypothetical protein